MDRQCAQHSAQHSARPPRKTSIINKSLSLYCSDNDTNSESQCRTMKCCPAFPSSLESINNSESFASTSSMGTSSLRTAQELRCWSHNASHWNRNASHHETAACVKRRLLFTSRRVCNRTFETTNDTRSCLHQQSLFKARAYIKAINISFSFYWQLPPRMLLRK